MLYLGCHLSASAGYLHMGQEAISIGANTFQFFTRNPRGGTAKPLDLSDIAAYLDFASAHGIGQIVAHAPYTLNGCSADDTLMGWIIDASPMGMMVLTEYLDEWGMKSPETFDELLDVCNEILEEGLLPEETGLLMQKYTQSGMMDLFMKYYIMTSLQEGRRLDFTDETFLHYVQRIKDELPAEEEPRMAFENIFMIPGASSAPSQMIQFVPRIFPEQNSAVETYVTIAVVNPYGKNQAAAIQFLEYCATHLTDGSYFIYDNLTEPIENPSMVAQLDELAEKIALLEQKADKERADEDTLRDLQEQYANMEQWRYFSSAEDIAYYLSLIHISEPTRH